MRSKPTEGSTDVLVRRVAASPMLADRPAPPANQVAPPWRLLLYLGSDGRSTLGVQVSPQMLVGRSDGSGNIPDLDLAPFNGQRSGVSRRHALITCENGTLFITDLHSTNGTRINGFQLEPGRSYHLRDGDELEFGRLRGVVRFVRALP